MADRPKRVAARRHRGRSRAATAAALALAASACASAPTTGETGRGRTEETVAAQNEPAAQSPGPPPLDDARAVHGTIDPTTGRRTAEPAIGERLREPVRTEIQSGRLRQADEAYTPDAGTLPIGFRVQVMATPDFTTAGAEASHLKQRLGPSSAVYVEYIDPYYKVRVGDFATQEAAQATLDAVRGLGYRDAWAVRTTIKKAGP
jgi:hypothetical protein